jgi:ParB family chromosome partitioning protein
MKQQQRLGKGLGALIEDASAVSAEEKDDGLKMISVNEIDPNAGQPRKHFDNEKLEELAKSIETYGIVQPIIVQENGNRYTIIAGERRYRAARLAGLKEVPVIVKEFSEAVLMEVSLVENLQREDLNPIEEAQAMRMLMDEHHLTQDELSSRLGKSRSAVANTLRLLSLPESVRSFVIAGELSSGHARCLVALERDEDKQRLAEKIVMQGLSVRATEELIKALSKPMIAASKEKESVPEIEEAEKTLTTALGTRVQIAGDLKRGKIILQYYNPEQLNSLFDFLMTSK